jgi:hypothetical protein
MRRSARLLFTATALIVTALVALPLGAAPKKERTTDKVWTRSDLADFRVERIAMIPVVTASNDLPSEKQVEVALAQALGASGYRWISPTVSRELLRAAAPNDSLLRAVRQQILAGVRVDSLASPRVCAKLRCRALLGVRIDQWEKRELEWGQSGKPSTSIQLRAALVDSTGALLWSVSTNETAEGQYHEAGSGTIGVTGGGLQRNPVTGQGGAPEFAEVIQTIAQRWAKAFPARAAAADTTAAPAAPAAR